MFCENVTLDMVNETVKVLDYDTGIDIYTQVWNIIYEERYRNSIAFFSLTGIVILGPLAFGLVALCTSICRRKRTTRYHVARKNPEAEFIETSV